MTIERRLDVEPQCPAVDHAKSKTPTPRPGQTGRTRRSARPAELPVLRLA